MKISEMDTVTLSRCLADLAVPVANLMEDKEINEAIADIGKEKGVTVLQQRGMMLRMLLPLALKKHGEDVFAVCSALTGKTVDEVRKQNGLTTLHELQDSIDKELMDFFMPSKPTAEKK